MLSVPISSTNRSSCQTDNPLLLSNPSAAHRSRETTASGNTDPLLSVLIPSTNCLPCQTDNPLLSSNPSTAHCSHATTASGNTDQLLSAPIPSINNLLCQTDTLPYLLRIARSLSTVLLVLANPRSLLTLFPKLARLAATFSSSLVRRLFRLSLLCALQNELHPVCASFVHPIHLHIHTFLFFHLWQSCGPFFLMSVHLP